ncbi:variable surface lipoprotein [Metamycoplasma canadense]|uniref:Protein G-related albumin-binding (GA) module domain-containing protein n=1 Tax=Metamycoplasma canadense TaxID=29554 RepID=A0A077L6B2_9BACT|nr:variable surface lipoprotein [Metamycoplasma canadense]BAP39497.1 hypothetical protein MCAN360_0281 [Metamycoplasma canadense]
MRKIKKFLLTFGFLAPLTTLPIISAACGNKKEETPKENEELNKPQKPTISEQKTNEAKNLYEGVLNSANSFLENDLKDPKYSEIKKTFDEEVSKAKKIVEEAQTEENYTNAKEAIEAAKTKAQKAVEEAKKQEKTAEAKKQYDASEKEANELLELLKDNKFAQIKTELEKVLNEAKEALKTEASLEKYTEFKQKIEAAKNKANEEKEKIEKSKKTAETPQDGSSTAPNPTTPKQNSDTAAEGLKNKKEKAKEELEKFTYLLEQEKNDYNIQIQKATKINEIDQIIKNAKVELELTDFRIDSEKYFWIELKTSKETFEKIKNKRLSFELKKDNIFCTENAASFNNQQKPYDPPFYLPRLTKIEGNYVKFSISSEQKYGINDNEKGKYIVNSVWLGNDKNKTNLLNAKNNLEVEIK